MWYDDEPIKINSTHGNTRWVYKMGEFLGEGEIKERKIKKYHSINRPSGRWKRSIYGDWYQGRSYKK